MAALIHPFVAGTAEGTAALDAAPGRARSSKRAAPSARRCAIASRPRWRPWSRVTAPSRWSGPRPGTRPSSCSCARIARAGARPAANTGAAEPGWRWDAAHNPLPLSPAQAGLVALVDARCAVPFAQQVIGGYLFYRPRDVEPAPSGGRPAGRAGRSCEELADAAAVWRPSRSRRRSRPSWPSTSRCSRSCNPRHGPRATRWRSACIDLGLPAAELLPALLASVPSAADGACGAGRRSGRVRGGVRRRSSRVGRRRADLAGRPGRPPRARRRRQPPRP